MSTVAKFKKEIAEQEKNEAFDPTAIPAKQEAANDTEPGDNASDYKKAAKLIEAVEREQAAIDEHAEEYKSKAAPHRDEMKSIKKRLRDDFSIEAKALSAILTKRRQDRRMAARIKKLEEPAKGQFEQLEMVL